MSPVLFTACAAALFALVFLAPLLPGLWEIVRSRDGARLPVAQSYLREPRYFGKAFDEKLQSVLRHASSGERRQPFLRRRDEHVRVASSFTIERGVCEPDVLVAREHITCGAGAKLTDLFSAGTLSLAKNCRARVACTRGNLRLESGCTIERWADAAGDAQIGDRCELGAATTSNGVLLLGRGCTFKRLFGLPVRTAPAAAAQAPSAFELDEELWAIGDRIVHEDLRIGSGATIAGNVKTDGSLVVEPESHVSGNLICRHAARIGRASSIDGHLFCEGDATIEDAVVIGSPQSHSTVYCAGRLVLGRGVTIYGSVVADGGGRVA